MSTTESSDLKGLGIAFALQVALSCGIIASFSFYRPYNRIIYEPRIKFSEEAKKPMPLNSKHSFSWYFIYF